MAVQWDTTQVIEVAGVLNAHPADSAACDVCALLIRGIGQTLDPATHCLSVRPKGRERFVVPKVHLERPWYYHFTTNVQQHCVDVLTDAPGTAADQYLETHWRYADALSITPEEPSDV